jgi:uncharacterized protein
VRTSREREPEVRISVRVTPRAGRDSIDGVRDGALVVRVAAPPADGAANVAVSRLLAGILGLAPSRIRVVAGASARRKVIAIEGLPRDVIAARWPGLGV